MWDFCFCDKIHGVSGCGLYVADGAGNPYLASVRKDVKTYSNCWLEYANILNKHAILAIVTNSNHLINRGGFFMCRGRWVEIYCLLFLLCVYVWGEWRPARYGAV